MVLAYLREREESVDQGGALVDNLLRPMFEAFRTASQIMLDPNPSLPPATVEKMATACKEFGRLYRAGVAGPFSCALNLTFSVKLKVHLFETHVPEFATKYGCIGCLGEASVESFHRWFNVYDRAFCAIHDPLRRWRYIADRARVNMRWDCEAASELGDRKHCKL